MKDFIGLIVVVWICFQLWQCHTKTDRGDSGDNTPVQWSEPSEGTKWRDGATESTMPRASEMTPEQRRAMQAWGNGGKRVYVERATELEERIGGRLVGGYRWGDESLRKARAALDALNRSIDRDEWNVAEMRYRTATEAVRLFEAGCRWTPGARHNEYRHIYAATQEGIWNADNGWVFVYPEEGSLEVARVCARCGGDGVEEVWVTCPTCNGTGRVETPLATGVKILNDVATGLEAWDDVSRALKGKPSRGSGVRRSNVPTQTCLTCNGRKRVQDKQACSRCSGSGYVR